MIQKIIDSMKLGKLEPENDKVEYKKSSNSFSKDSLSTYSAFANTNGGVIFYGIDEKKENFITGIDNLAKIKDEAMTLLNNSQKVNTNILTAPDFIEYEINEKKILILNIPKANYSQKPIYLNNNPYDSYKRNGSGDYKCTNDEVLAMLRDASPESQDSVIINEFDINEAIDNNTLKKYRQLFANLKPQHPFNQLDDTDFLYKINAIGKVSSGKLNPTLAGILMFGKQEIIRQIIPHYHLEYIDVTHTNENQRWNERIVYDGSWGEGNIYNFFNQVISILTNSIPNKFNIINSTTRTEYNEIQIALREAFVNSLVHADYRIPEKVIIKKNNDEYIFKNPGSLRITEDEFYKGNYSKPRNPLIATMFRHVNLAEEAGSGIPQIFKAINDYKLSELTILNDISSVTITLHTSTKIEELINNGIVSGDEIKLLKYAEKVLYFNRKDIEDNMSISKKSAYNLIKNLLSKDIISTIGKGSATKYYLNIDKNHMKRTLKMELESIIQQIDDIK